MLRIFIFCLTAFHIKLSLLYFPLRIFYSRIFSVPHQEEYEHAVHPIITTVCGLLALQKELLPREQHNHGALRAFYKANRTVMFLSGIEFVFFLNLICQK